eukprot:gene2477-3233_t
MAAVQPGRGSFSRSGFGLPPTTGTASRSGTTKSKEEELPTPNEKTPSVLSTRVKKNSAHPFLRPQGERHRLPHQAIRMSLKNAVFQRAKTFAEYFVSVPTDSTFAEQGAAAQLALSLPAPDRVPSILTPSRPIDPGPVVRPPPAVFRRRAAQPTAAAGTGPRLGKLTPDEFVQSADLLIKTSPAWSWASTPTAATRVSYLPEDKQVVPPCRAPDPPHPALRSRSAPSRPPRRTCRAHSQYVEIRDVICLRR